MALSVFDGKMPYKSWPFKPVRLKRHFLGMQGDNVGMEDLGFELRVSNFRSLKS